jgi:hypothetical protein
MLDIHTALSSASLQGTIQLLTAFVSLLVAIARLVRAIRFVSPWREPEARPDQAGRFHGVAVLLIRSVRGRR